ncbi:MAG: alternative oxidase [Fimbriimonadaceae bacterium]|nr:alternative oxidase [Alphaproteobacteria bacterium]
MTPNSKKAELTEKKHRSPESLGDSVALTVVKMLRWIADKFFYKRYGHRAVVLETVAGVPGMVGGVLQHLRSLRRMSTFL